MTPDVSVILVSYNKSKMTCDSLSRLHEALVHQACEVILVDNASEDSPIPFVRQYFSCVRVIENKENRGFGRANNQALEFVTGRYVLLLNTDAFVESDSIGKAVAFMDSHPRCGILGARLVGRDGGLQPSCRHFPTPWNLFVSRTGLDRALNNLHTIDNMSWDHDSPRRCDWVPGCFYMIRKDVIDDIGLFDARYFLYYEEVDHCFAAKRAGWDVMYFPDTQVVHLEGESSITTGEVPPGGSLIDSLHMESELLYFRKNYGLGAVLTNLLLEVAAGLINSGKRLLSGRYPIGIMASGRRSGQFWRIAYRTRFGTRPIH